MKITPAPDCGNSPKNRFAGEAAVALHRADRAWLEAHMSGDIVWEIPARGVHEGLEPVLAATGAVSAGAKALTLATALSHGRDAAVNGTLVMKDGRRIAFCHMIRFASVKADRIARIISYLVEDA